MAINQISTANTFEGWLTATQALISVANTLTDGRDSTFLANTNLTIDGVPNSAKLNVRTSAAINTLYANTANLANTEFIGSNVTSLRVTTTAAVGTDLKVYGDVTISGNLTLDAVGPNDVQIAGSINIANTLNATTIGANTAFFDTANVTSLVGSANTAIYSTINSADDRALAYSIIFS